MHGSRQWEEHHRSASPGCSFPPTWTPWSRRVSRRPAPDRRAMATDVEVKSHRGNTMDGTRITVGIPTFNRADLLSQAIASVLEQTYPNFRLIVSDNASTDETQALVASVSDPRLQYVRAETNIGMIGNFNRVIELAETEFLMLLPDDDRLYPDYLGAVVDVLERNPRVGLVHTAFDEIDIESRVHKHGASYVKTSQPVMVEPGDAFLERSMTSTAVLLSSTTYRTQAIRQAGGMTTREEPFADVPLFMRLAQSWDLAYVDRPPVGFRVHDQTETIRLAPRGQSEVEERNRELTYARIMLDRRMGFLDGAGLARGQTRRDAGAAAPPFV